MDQALKTQIETTYDGNIIWWNHISMKTSS